ncbi:MAG: hypothetical protein AAFU73_03795 [Planctomycetota bacterium]
MRELLDGVFHDVGLDGNPLVWTPRYKARVSEAGLTFRPFLGSDAPTTYPIRLSLDAVTIHGARATLDAAPSINRSDDRITLDRGVLLEHYDFDVESVEQSFVLPAGTKGEVLVEVDLDVDPSYAWTPSTRSWAHERGAVTLSEAVVFTAGGQELAIPCDVEGDRMSMRVPADFLETAEGAIVIDPVISTDSIETVETEFLQQTSAAYDPSTDRYCVSVGFHFANDDRDTMSILVSGTTAEISAPVFLEMSAADVSLPSTGGNSGTSSFLTTMWLWGTAGGGPPHESVRVVTRRRDAASGSLSAPRVLHDVAIDGPLADFEVGSDPYPAAGTFYMLATVEQFDYGMFGTLCELYVQLLDDNGVRVGPKRLIDSRPYGYRLSMTPTMGSPSLQMEWVLLYQSSSRWTRGVRLNYDGRILSGPSLVTEEPIPLPSITSPTPVPGGFFGRPTVLVEGPRVAESSEVLALAASNLSLTGDQAVLGDSLGAARGARHRFGRAVALPDGWGTWAWSPGANVARLVQPIGSAFGVSDAGVAIPEGHETTMSGASEYEWGGSRSRRVLITAMDVTDDNVFVLRTLLLDFPSGDAAGSLHCAGPENSTGVGSFMAASGGPSRATEKTLHGRYLPPDEIGYMLVGFTPQTATTIDSGLICIGSGYDYLSGIRTTDSSGALDVVIDPMSIDLNALGTIGASAGQTLNFQLWCRDGASSTATNAVSITFE